MPVHRPIDKCLTELPNIWCPVCIDDWIEFGGSSVGPLDRCHWRTPKCQRFEPELVEDP